MKRLKGPLKNLKVETGEPVSNIKSSRYQNGPLTRSLIK